MKQKQKRRKSTARKTGTIEKVEEYVCKHLAEQVSLHAVAEYCGVSVSTITQTFQKRQNTTFHRYLTQQRMKAADELIRTEMPLEEVGRMVGFTDHSTFYRAFHQSFGMSPREYRREIQAKEGG